MVYRRLTKQPMKFYTNSLLEREMDFECSNIFQDMCPLLTPGHCNHKNGTFTLKSIQMNATENFNGKKNFIN